ncbi:MAG: hypothetical protein ACI8UR_000901 [Natronomonas sp.]|jgi:hypothetical protein
MYTNDQRETQRLCEWASLTGERLPEEYGPCGPENDS